MPFTDDSGGLQTPDVVHSLLSKDKYCTSIEELMRIVAYPAGTFKPQYNLCLQMYGDMFPLKPLL